MTKRIVNCISIFILIFHTCLSYFHFCIYVQSYLFQVVRQFYIEKDKDSLPRSQSILCCRGSDAILPRIAILVLLRTINTKQLANRQKSIRILHIVPVQSIFTGLNEENNDIPDENTMRYLPPSPPPDITRKTHGTPPDVLCPRPPGHTTLDLELCAEANGI